MYSDAHCHLDEFKDVKELVEAAKKKKVSRIVTNAVDLESMEKSIALAKEFKEINCALGLHPSNLLRASDKELEAGLQFIRGNIEHCIAVGEIGLDFKHAKLEEEKEKQKLYFAEQLRLAEELNKPVIVHSRLAVEEALEAMSCFKGKVLLHWFTGSSKQLVQAIELGAFFSVGPAVEFDEEIQRIALEVPLDRLLSETDSPVPFRGKQARPEWIPGVVEKIAEVKSLPTARVEAAIEANFKKFFP